MGSRDPCDAPSWKFFSGLVGTFPASTLVKLEVCNFSHFGTITILRPENLRGHLTLATPPFRNFFSVQVGTFPESMLLKFEVCIFSHFGAN